jgi:hypothetical protein
MHAMQPKLLAQLVQLCYETLHTPQATILRTIGLATAKLIIENHRAFIRQRFQRRHTPVGRPWPAVQRHKRNGIAAAHYFVPHQALGDLHIAFAPLYRLRHRCLLIQQ